MFEAVNYLTIIAVMPTKGKIKYIVISILLLTLSFGLIRSSVGIFKGGKRLTDLESEVSSLQDRKYELEENIEYKKTDEYVEEKARNDLNLIKPGEIIYVISGPGSEEYSPKNVLSSSAGNTGVFNRQQDQNWYQWYKLFF